MRTPRGFFSFMDIMMGLVGILILINIILALNMSQQQVLQVRILPKDMTDENRKLVPVYAICDGENIMIGNRIMSVPTNEDDVQSLADEIFQAINLAGPDAYLLALIRPNGFDAFRRVRAAVEQLRSGGTKIDIGYEPINRDWEITEDK